MKNTLVILFFIGLTIQTFAQTQSELTMNSLDQFSEASKELKTVITQIESDYKTDTLFLSKLKISQEIWLKFVAAEIEMKYPEPDKRNYGSIFPMCANGYLEQMTIQRTKKLKEWLLPVPKGEGCIGSVKYRFEAKEKEN